MEEERTFESCNAVVTITGRGPIRVEGTFEVTDTSGIKITYENETVKFCGCGRSENMPYCDGAHKR